MKTLLRAIRRKILPGWNDEWPYIIEKARNCNTLQLGSGLSNILPSIVNVDVNEATNPDVVFNLNNKPFPFDDNSFDMVIAISILEHLTDFFAVMGEIHRIAKPGASIHILVPHFSSSAAFIDPTHCQLLSAHSCDYFITGTDIERHYSFYLDYRFKLKKRYIGLAGIWNYILPLHWLAEKKTAFWEEHLCFIFRGNGIYWELTVEK